MGLNLTKYSTLLKVLCVIPVLTGFLSLSDAVLPTKIIETEIVSKKESYRAKFDKTTYNIYFKNNNDQFTKEIFDVFQQGDQVILTVSFVDEEVQQIQKLGEPKVYINSTGEVYFKYGFAILFIIPLLVWFKKRPLSNKQSKYLIFIILMSIFSFIRIVRMQIN